MKLFGGSGLVKTTFFVVCVASLLVIVMASSAEVEKSSDNNLISSHNVEESSLQPHKRSKRTIGHIFDMFKKMMDGLFGGGKKGGGKNKGRGRRPGAPPSGGYGAPQRPRRPSYGRRPQQPVRNTGGGLSGGYAGGAPPVNNYGAASPPSNNYGAAQPASNGYGGPQAQPASNNYGGPQQQQNIDSYGSPQADPVGSLDSYGSPAADPIGNQDSYGSPVAAPVGPSQSSYGNAPPAPPVRNNRPQSTEFGPSSVFYMIPAPNLATEAPQGGRGNNAGSAGDSYGSPLADPVRGNSGGNQDSYGAPQADPIGGGAGDSYGSPQGDPIRQSAPDSYGSPVGQPIRQSAPASGGYNSPQTNSVSLSSSYNVAPASGNAGSSNPFLSNQQSTYGGSAQPLPVTNNDLSGNFVPFNNNNQDSYGSPVGPVTDLNLPEDNQVVIAGRGNSNNIDSYGSPVTGAPAIVEERQPDYDGSIAPVGTSAPVPDEFLDNSQADSFDSYNNNDVERAPEGEVSNVQVDDEEGESSPLFEDLRNVAFTSADDQTSTEAISADIESDLEVDLRGDFVDLTNGLDEYSAGEIDLTNYQETTPIPSLDDTEEYEYIGDEDVPPEFPESLIEDVEIVENPTDNDADSLANGLENQESYGQQESSNYDGSESEYEYYYDYEEDYEVDPEQLPDTYGQTTASPIRSSTANFISVPLMIEEVAAKDNTAPVILAGSTGGSAAVDTNQLSSYGNRNTKRRAPHAFHQFLVDPPQAKRQADWSQRLDARRNFVWRQFNLD